MSILSSLYPVNDKFLMDFRFLQPFFSVNHEIKVASLVFLCKTKVIIERVSIQLLDLLAILLKVAYIHLKMHTLPGWFQPFLKIMILNPYAYIK